MQDQHRPYSDIFDAFRTMKQRSAILDQQSLVMIRGSRKAIERSHELLERTREQALRVDVNLDGVDG